jgi:predicted transposase/invertase (TIGR01784 family)
MMPRPHDALFKAAFDAPADAAALLRALLPAAVREAVAWDTLGHERGSFVDKRLADQHSDLLFSARLRTGKPALVYFLLEHQSTRDPAMPQRMLSYQSRIWDRLVRQRPKAQLAPVVAVLVSHVPGGWTAARAFEELFDPAVMAISGLAALVPRCSMIVEDLMQLTNNDLAARPLAAFPKLTLWLLRDARDSVGLLDSFDAWIPAMLELDRTRSGRDSFAALITYMFQVIDPMDQDELHAKIRELGPRSEKVAMTIAEQLHEQGRKKGLEEGLKKGLRKGRKKGHEEGLEKGRIATLRSLLVFKFQTVGAAYEARLQAATPEAIDRYLQRLLTADSLAKVFED